MALTLSGMALATGVVGYILAVKTPAASAVPLRNMGKLRCCMIRRMLIVMTLVFGCGTFGPLTEPVQACPMCKVANEQDSLLPRAYMYSILFMMGMMFSLAGGVAFAMYLIGRRENAELDGLEQFGLQTAGEAAR